MREKDAQLEWEARAGRIAAGIALLCGALLVVAFGYSIAELPRSATNTKAFLIGVEAHKDAYVISGVLAALSMLAFIPPLLYLYEVTVYRRPELPKVARILAIAGPVIVAVFGIWLQFRQGHAADLFKAATDQTNKHAEKVFKDTTTAVAGVKFAGSIATGLATIVISLNAMRAGLLSRFMGALGIILGAVFVLPIIPSPVIQLFWVLALGALFLGNWPGGRGPAWDAGEAIPWPVPQRGLPPVEDDEEDGDEEPGDAAQPDAAVAQPNPRAARKRKKRKARR